MKKLVKRVLLIFALLFMLCAAVVGKMFIQIGNEMKELVFYDANMDRIDDGEYEGSSETALVKVKVAVKVEDHKIIKIDILEHVNGKGKEAENITGAMIENNTYKVDAISGATVSSEVIKSAVSHALWKGEKQ